MTPLDDRFQEWQQRVSRFSRLSTLLREEKGRAPLRAVAAEMERQLERLRDLTETGHDLRRYSSVLISELDFLLTRWRGGRLRASGFSAEDIREEARMCLDEAKAAVAETLRKSLASRAFLLAQVAERVNRGETSPEEDEGGVVAPGQREETERTFVARQNVERYRRVLAEGGLDDARRELVEKLLDEELAGLGERR